MENFTFYAVYEERFLLLKNNPKENITILASFKISSINGFINFSVYLGYVN